jgi:hypothetical protein
MKSYQLLPLSALLLLGLPAYRPAPAITAVEIGKDDPRRETREVASFTAVTMSTSAEVEVRQGNTQRVEVQAASSDLAELETEVKNGKLIIRQKDHTGIRWKGFSGPVKVFVTMPQVRALSVSGSGTLRAPEAIKAEQLAIAVSGSGKMEVPLQVQALSTSISGSGSVQLNGSAPKHDISVSGSGKVQATELRSESCHVTISGSGQCRVQVATTLDAHIAGSGNVYYTGNPHLNTRISGSGKVVKG